MYCSLAICVSEVWYYGSYEAHHHMIIRTLQMMFKAINKPAKFVYVPTEIFDFSISIIEFIAKTWPSQKWEDVLETSKIGKYYAVEVRQYG